MTTTDTSAVQTTLSLLQDLLSFYHPRNFAVRLWDGSTFPPEEGQEARFTLVLQHPGALRSMFLPLSEMALGEAYIYDDFDIEGDIEAVFDLAQHFMAMSWGKLEQLRYGARLLTLPKRDQKAKRQYAANVQGSLHTKETDRQAVSHHYDRSNDFYKLFLDRTMTYTCAYFESPEEDIDTAQAHKLAYICRKLRLQPGERLLDIGCGWGGLMVYAAQQYGVEVVGITLSQEQASLARKRIQEAGVADKCRVDICDYRDATGIYDKLVSIGMFEQVGEAKLNVYFKQAWNLLRPGGVFLNHAIFVHTMSPPPPKESFIDRYVFPGGELLTLPQTLKAAEAHGFEVRDVESLREHYVYTLREWVRRLEQHATEAKQITDEVTYRIWRLYMSSSIYAFKVGTIGLHQSLLVKPDNGKSGFPLTRADWYK